MVLLLLYVTIKLFIFHATQWPVNKSPPSTSQSSLTLGLMLNSDHAQSILDTGPQADSVEVSGFCLCVVWFVCCWMTSLPLVIIPHDIEVVEQWRKIKSFCSGVVYPHLPCRWLLTWTSILKIFVCFSWVENYFLTRPSNNVNLTSFWLKSYFWESMLFSRFLFFYSFILFLGEVFPCVLGREVRFAAISGRFDSRGCCVAL